MEKSWDQICKEAEAIIEARKIKKKRYVRERKIVERPMTLTDFGRELGVSGPKAFRLIRSGVAPGLAEQKRVKAWIKKHSENLT